MLNASRLEGANDSEEPPKGGLSRRLFLGGAAAAGASLFANHAEAGPIGRIIRNIRQKRNLPPAQIPFDVNTFLKNFPKDIPHIVDYDLEINEGAKRGVVILRQMHWTEDIANWQKPHVEACQSELYGALEYLMKHRRVQLRKVFREGKMADSEYDARKPNLSPGEALTDASYRAIFGAEQALSERSALVLAGAEYAKEYDESGTALLTGLNQWKELYEDREDALLDIVHKTGDAVAYTVYGAAHKWSNNVYWWNKENPDHKFSLLTLTPNAVRKHIDTIAGIPAK